VTVHDFVGVLVLIVAGVGAVIALGSMWRPSLLPPLRVYLRLTWALVVLQVLVGLVLVLTGHRPQVLHWVYGAATLSALPVALRVGRRLGGRDEHIWIVGGAVATALLAFRAIATG